MVFSEWNSSPIVKATTSRGKRRKLLTPLTFSLIHATDFSDRVEREIVPSLKAGAIVLADRYVYTAFARDVVRGVDPQLGALALPLRGGADARRSTSACRSRSRSSASCRAGPSSSGTRPAWTSGCTPIRTSPTGCSRRASSSEYEQLVPEFGLTVMDATQPVEIQQRAAARARSGRTSTACGAARARPPSARGGACREAFESYGVGIPGVDLERADRLADRGRGHRRRRAARRTSNRLRAHLERAGLRGRRDRADALRPREPRHPPRQAGQHARLERVQSVLRDRFRRPARAPDHARAARRAS